MSERPITWPATVFERPRPLAFRRQLDVLRILSIRFNTSSEVWMLTLLDLDRNVIGSRIIVPSDDLFKWERVWRPETAPAGRLIMSRVDGKTDAAGRFDLFERRFVMTYASE
jgi:hypothetical protein